MEKLTVRSKIKAPVEKVWEYYTLPEHITKWNFASEEWHCPVAHVDLTKGGKLSYRMEARDGSMGFDFEGTYDKIISFNEILYHLDDQRAVQVVFNKISDKKTEVVIHFDPENTNPHNFQQQGWQAILNNF
jgi:uncharacterized protein YndB with AHSA1/START domain